VEAFAPIREIEWPYILIIGIPETGRTFDSRVIIVPEVQAPLHMEFTSAWRGVPVIGRAERKPRSAAKAAG
jgi:hypothetical protein